MPTQHIVALLILERDKITRAIEALQGPMKRRGRPPKNQIALTEVAVEAKRSSRTPAQRKAQAKRMKEYWAKRKKEAAK